MNIHIKSSLAAIAFSLFFYSKSLGLNLFLISILAVVLISTMTARKTPWKFSLIYVLSAAFVFINPSNFTVFVHFMAFAVFVGKSISQKSSIYLSWLMGIVNMAIGTIANLSNSNDHEQRKQKELAPKTLIYIKSLVISSICMILFALLYKNANPVFDELTSQIDFSFVSFRWLLFTAFGYFLFLNLLRPYPPKELITFDNEHGNDLEKPTALVLIKKKKQLNNEHTLGSMVFSALNLLLIFFLSTDIIYLLQDAHLSNSDYSQSVHQGVYALMFSIVCAIALILYFFRGNLNFFKHNKRIKSLTYLWIILNVILIVFTCIKNYAYVEALGFTYKRIGVFVYLLLTLTGLITAYIKVAEVKNFIYLVRTNIAAVFAFLIVSAAIPWDKTITWYNLSHIENPDLWYLINLGDQNSEQLYEYANTKTSVFNGNSKESIQEKHTAFIEAQSQKTWQEFTLYQLINSKTK